MSTLNLLTFNDFVRNFQINENENSTKQSEDASNDIKTYNNLEEDCIINFRLAVCYQLHRSSVHICFHFLDNEVTEKSKSQKEIN